MNEKYKMTLMDAQLVKYCRSGNIREVLIFADLRKLLLL